MAESSRKTKDPTRLRNLVIRRMGINKVPIQIDPQTSRASGSICKLFESLSSI